MLNFNPEQTLRLIRERATRQMNRARGALSWSPVDSVEANSDSGTNSTTTPPVATLGVSSIQPKPDSDSRGDRGFSGGSSFSGGGNSGLRGDAALPFRIDDSLLRRNLRALEQHILEDHYTRWFYPGSAILEGTTTTPILPTPRFAVISFPKDGTTSAVHFTFGRPSQWLDGKLYLRFWYSSPTASANNFRLFAQVSTLTTGEVSTAAALSLSMNLTLPGPTVANTLIKAADVMTTANLNRTDELISVRIGRSSGNAADTNANACHIYAVRAEMALTVQEG